MKPFLQHAQARSLYVGLLGLVFACLGATSAYADVGVILNDSLDTSLARITGSGHSAIYLSRVCPESPIRLRLCHAGEPGSVISNYTTLGEDQPFEWNVVPLSVYLYGVDDPAQRPVFGTWGIKHLLEEKYRDEYIAPYCQTEKCRTSNTAEWREMVGATLERSFYIFVVDTTVAQDEAFIREFNAAPNKNTFNGVSRNCATFTRRIINFYFPHSAHADYINDFGMTSPKAIARSFTHYASEHPEMNFRVLHFAQLPGTIKRSGVARSGTEEIFHSIKFDAPLALFLPYVIPVTAGTYVVSGHFSPEHELATHPAVVQASTESAGLPGFQPANFGAREPDRRAVFAMARKESAEIVGTKRERKQYREQLDGIEDEAVTEGIIPDRGYPERLVKQLGERDVPVADGNGELSLEVEKNGRPRHVTVSANSILGRNSDSQLAYALLLARVEHVLNSPKHRRETMVEFQDDWKLMQEAREKLTSTFATAAGPAKNSRPALVGAN